jgi:putative FmdB family regulatory protein
MPVYEYECKACHREFEYQQRMSDPDKTTCEACGGSLDRLISRTAFQLKGSGWYKDLYSSPSQKPAEGAKPDAKSDSAGSTAAADKGGGSDTSAPAPAPAPASTGGSSSGTGGSTTSAVASKAT